MDTDFERNGKIISLKNPALIRVYPCPSVVEKFAHGGVDLTPGSGRIA
jgi:hypothetical protein